MLVKKLSISFKIVDSSRSSIKQHHLDKGHTELLLYTYVG